MVISKIWFFHMTVVVTICRMVFWFISGDESAQSIRVLMCPLWKCARNSLATLGYHCRYFYPLNLRHLTLRCKIIRTRILGVGAGWLGFALLGCCCQIGWPHQITHQTTPHQIIPNLTKNLFARASPGTIHRAMRGMVTLYRIFVSE